MVELVSAHGGILVFLKRPPETVQLQVYCSFCLGNVIFVGRVPAKVNQGRDDQNLNQ